MKEPWFDKRLAVLFGSPHREGNTGRLLNAFLAALPSGLAVDFADMYQWALAPCTDCGFCKTKEGCALPDFPLLDKLVQESDYLVIATPVYNFSVPAPLKAFLDRTQCYYNARFCRGLRPPVPRQKKAVLLLTAGNPDPIGAEIVERQFKAAFTILNTELAACVRNLGTDEAPTGEVAFQQAQQAARRLLLP